MIPLLLVLSAAAFGAAPAKKSSAPQKGKKVTAKTPDPSRARATLQTDMGDITIRFFPDKAPHHVQNFLELASKGVYDGVLFHRVIPGFMIQTGDPLTKDAKTPRESMGTGGYIAPAGEKEQPGFAITNMRSESGSGRIRNVKAEFNDVSHKRGIVSMARANDPNSASSQFFIVVKDSTFLDKQYTAFGEVVSGMEVADKIAAAPRDERDNLKSPLHIKKVVISDAEPGK
jgi:peptidyl-prolyl cis-trans isomerase B (cyclophilin B)